MLKFGQAYRAPISMVIEIGSSHVAAAHVRERQGRNELVALAWRDLVSDGSIGQTVPNDLGPLLQEVVDEVGATASATLIIPGHLALTKSVRVPLTAAAQQEKLIAFEARQSIPFPLAEVFWSYQVLGSDTGELEVMLVAAKSDAVRALIEVVTATGVQVGVVLPAGLTLREIDLPATGTDLVVCIGARSTHLLFRSRDRLQMRTLPLAGQDITRAMAEQLDQTLAAAERLKTGGGGTLPADPPMAVRSATNRFVERLQLEINRSLVTQAQQSGRESPGVLKLSGGGAEVPGLFEVLGTKWQGPVEPLAVSRDWQVGAAAQRVIGPVGIGRLADMFGAGQLALGSTNTVNLVPPELRETREARRRQPLRFIAAALLLGAVLLPGVHSHRLANARDQATDDLIRRLGPVQSLQDDIRRSLDELAHLQTETQVLAQRVKAQHAWPGLLADFQARLTAVGEVWLEGLQVLPPAPPVVANGRGQTVDADDGSVAPQPPMRLRLSGRLLDRENPLSRVSQPSFERATSLLNQLVESPRVMDVVGERFDASQPGILRFDFTLVINPAAQL